jgi:hypothetical protein
MAGELDRPPTRSELNRLLIANALTKPFPNVVLPAGVAVAGIAFGIAAVGILVAVVAWLALAVATYFDSDEADKVSGRLRAGRRAAVDKGAPVVDPTTLAQPIAEQLQRVLSQEARIRDAIARADLPFAEVSQEVDGFVRAARRTASRAQLLYEYLEDEDRRRVEVRLTEVQAQVDAGDESKRPLVEALSTQLLALERMALKLGGFYTEMERVAVELGNVRGQLLSVSAASDAADQRDLAAGVRDLREQMGAVAEGMSEVLDATPGAPNAPPA